MPEREDVAALEDKAPDDARENDDRTDYLDHWKSACCGI